MKIIAVIVTYNRLDLLKKCLAAVAAQSRLPNETLVINNGSTDETADWLSQQPVDIFTQANTGGAGGFTAGIKLAYERNADWIWLMDDDTIPTPTALEALLSYLTDLGDHKDHVGFLASTVFWTDGTIHQMNQTYSLTDKKKLGNLSITIKDKFPLIQFGTFVSMLLSAKAIEKVGLPIAAYFIWNDDVEYSKRIIANGLAGIVVKASLVLHETPSNQKSDVFIDSHANLWKYGYGMRNELFTKRHLEGDFQFWASWMHRIFIMPFRLAINRKDHRWAFIKLIWKTSVEAIYFRPTIEVVTPTETSQQNEKEK